MRWDEVGGSAPMQTFRPHSRDILICWNCADLPFLDSRVFFILLISFSWHCCTVVGLFFLLPVVVCRFECIHCLFLPDRVRDAVPCFGGLDVEKVAPYFQWNNDEKLGFQADEEVCIHPHLNATATCTSDPGSRDGSVTDDRQSNSTDAINSIMSLWGENMKKMRENVHQMRQWAVGACTRVIA